MASFKASAIEAYKASKERLAEKGSVSSVTYSTFDSAEEIEKLSPAEVYKKIRIATSPDENSPYFPKISWKYAGFRNTENGDDVIVDFEITLTLPEKNQTIKDSMLFTRENGKLFFRILHAYELILKEEISRNRQAD